MRVRILVTGANGHVGCNLVRELLSRGHAVVALVRPNADVRGLAGLPIETVHGDVLDEATVLSAAHGCDAIVNLAATYQLGGDTAAIVKPAVDAIRNVLGAAAKVGASRVVHTSSIVAVGYGDSPDEIRDERHWNERPFDAYFQAKTESERQAWALAKELGVALVCVNPGGIVGPFDYRCTPSTHYLEALASGRGQTVVGGANYVDVRDVALVHALALERGVAGERYLCVGENLEWRRMGEHVEALTGRPFAHAGLPRWAVVSYATVVEAFDRMRGVEPRMSRTAVSETAGRWAWFDGTKTREAFGYTPRTTEDMIETALRWGIFIGRVQPDGFRGSPEPDPSWVK